MVMGCSDRKWWRHGRVDSVSAAASMVVGPPFSGSCFGKAF